MSEETSLYEVVDKVSVITMNRPDKLNSLNAALKDSLTKNFARAEEDPNTSVVLLRGAGRSFCAGYDLSGDPDAAERKGDAIKTHAHLSKSIKFATTPWNLRKPVIAAVKGHALGFGCQLAMFCDLTVASDNAKFGEPESRFGGTGPGFVMRWMIGFKKARELTYFGDTIDAEEALRLGMINRILPTEGFEEAALKYAKRLTLIAPEALVMTKLAINRGADASGFMSAMQGAVDVVAPLYAATTEVGTKFKEISQTQGVAAAVKWRRAQFEE